MPRRLAATQSVSPATPAPLWALRIDYGFDRQEMISLTEKMPIVLNASTVTAGDAAEIAAKGREVFAMHNFYPRPETGLDEEYLMETTKRLQAAGLKVLNAGIKDWYVSEFAEPYFELGARAEGEEFLVNVSFYLPSTMDGEDTAEVVARMTKAELTELVDELDKLCAKYPDRT